MVWRSVKNVVHSWRSIWTLVLRKTTRILLSIFTCRRPLKSEASGKSIATCSDAVTIRTHYSLFRSSTKMAELLATKVLLISKQILSLLCTPTLSEKVSRLKTKSSPSKSDQSLIRQIVSAFEEIPKDYQK